MPNFIGFMSPAKQGFLSQTKSLSENVEPNEIKIDRMWRSMNDSCPGLMLQRPAFPIMENSSRSYRIDVVTHRGGVLASPSSCFFFFSMQMNIGELNVPEI